MDHAARRRTAVGEQYQPGAGLDSHLVGGDGRRVEDASDVVLNVATSPTISADLTRGQRRDSRCELLAITRRA